MATAKLHPKETFKILSLILRIIAQIWMRKLNSATCNNIRFLFASYKKYNDIAVLAIKTISVLSWAFDVACLNLA